MREMNVIWELCFVRPSVTSGAEVTFFHPQFEDCKSYRSLKDFVATRGAKVGTLERSLEVRAISFLLAAGWEPLGVSGGVGSWSTTLPDAGATGYAFRRRVEGS
jgi:hypothetical protein